MSRTLDTTIIPVSLDQHMIRGMSPKKQHEVCHMASVVDNVCKDSRCKGIVDVGSGLGYLSLVLSDQLDYPVLGIECEESRCQAALHRTNKLIPEKIPNFCSTPLWLKDTEESRDKFQNILQKYFNNKNNRHNRQVQDKNCEFSEDCTSNTDNIVHTATGVSCHNAPESTHSTSDLHVDGEDTEISVCLIGLHCCGDLTPTMLEIFTQIKEIKSLVVLGCCYHRMKIEDGQYNQFPMSSYLKKIMFKPGNEHEASWNITSYGFRLAAQETRSRWKNQSGADHAYHQNNVAYRGVLDLVLEMDGLKMIKDKRKLVNKQQYHDFTGYVDTVLDRISLEGDVDKVELKDKLLQTFSDHKQEFQLIEPFTCLQVLLQGVLESAVLYDRLQYLREHGLHAKLVPIMDDFISPRNMAIVATK